MNNWRALNHSFPKMAAAPATPPSSTATTITTFALPKPFLSSKLPFRFHQFTPSCPSKALSSFAVSCSLDSRALQMATGTSLLQRPDSFGRFGKFGGKYVPETLMHALSELESAFHSLAADEGFQVLLTPPMSNLFWFICLLGFHSLGCLRRVFLLGRKYEFSEHIEW